MRKTYEARTQKEAKVIIMKIIFQKVREIVGDKPIRIKVKCDD